MNIYYIIPIIIIAISACFIIVYQKQTQNNKLNGKILALIDVFSLYKSKTEALEKNNTLILDFYPIEILLALINPQDIHKELSTKELINLYSLLNVYENKKTILALNYPSWKKFSYELIAQIDLIVPYYKICGASNVSVLETLEHDKKPYRNLAKKLIKQNKILSHEWIALLKEFMQKFHYLT